MSYTVASPFFTIKRPRYLLKRTYKICTYALCNLIFSTATIFGFHNQTNSNTLRLLAVGDVLLHMPIIRYAQEGGSYNFGKIFTSIAPFLEGYDIAFYNQESPIAGDVSKLSGYPCFNSPPQIADTMVRLGFNVVSLANNHTMDKGIKGVLNSVQLWKNKNVDPIGSYATDTDANQPAIKEKNGIRYALFAYTTLTNQAVPIDKPYLLNTFTKEKAKKDITSVRPAVDLVIVSMHWGVEYDHLPSKSQQDIAHYLAELGVDIILGHHPHVIQPIQMLNNTLVIYSLGNFLSSQSTDERLTGMVVTMDIKKAAHIEKGSRIRIDKPHVLLTYNYHAPKGSYYTIYPYHELDERILPSYRAVYNTHKDLLLEHFPTLEIDPLALPN
jgi:hypothetical protein